jgi:outer membrane protein assembly factor BamE
MRIFIIFMTVLGIAGCKQNPELPAMISPYKIDIQQGNVVSQEMVGKLKAGMTRSQVRFVLGSPLVVDMFHSDRWDYIYLLQRQGKPDDRRRLTVIFDGDKLLRVEGDVVLTDKMQEPELPATKPPAAATPATKPTAAKPLAATAAPVPEAKKPVEKPPVVATPIAKPETPVAEKPAATKIDAKTGAAADAATADAAKADDKKDAAKQRGFFGKMLEKIGL